MNHNRAFSDTEIVTIAAVAAAALGGIVVGLGRGQEKAAQSPSAGERVRELSSAGVSSAREALPRREQIAGQAQHLQDKVSDLPHPEGADLASFRSAIASLAENVKQSELGQEVEQALGRLSDPERAVKAVRSSAADVADSGEKRLPSRDQVGSVLSRAGTAIVSSIIAARQMKEEHGDASGEKAADAAAALRSRMDAAIEKVAEHAPSSEQTADARERAAGSLERHVADPVSRAASSTKDATQEAVTATLWLAAGAALVYFGLLSSERREQVKSVLCGAYDQARLLALDFQGYESDM